MFSETIELDGLGAGLRQVLTALQKDRSLRFQTAESMSVALDDLRHRLGYVSDKNVVAPAPTQRSVAAIEPKQKQSRTWLWLVPVLVLMFIIGAAGIFAMVKWLSNGVSNAGRSSTLLTCNSTRPVCTARRLRRRRLSPWLPRRQRRLGSLCSAFSCPAALR
jgi:cytochrome c-type biogenesis protein CcmH/NrfG